MCVSLRETVGDRDVDDEATWTYSRRVSRRDTHIRCAPSKKRENHASLLPDQEVFGLLALGGEGLEPARLLAAAGPGRSEEHTSELESLMRISYAVFCLKKKNTIDEEKE